MTIPPLSPAAVLAGRRRIGPLLVAALLGHLLLVSLQVNTAGGVTVFSALVFGAFGEVQRLVGAAASSVGDAWRQYVALAGVQEENARLRARIDEIEIGLHEQRTLALRAERLETLLGMRARVPQRTLAAEVIAGDATSWFRTVTISRGRADGIAPDMAVLAPQGLVGRVVGRPPPTAHAARVQLLVDRSAAAAAMIERSRAGGIVVGDDGVMLRMEYVSTLADVQVGDAVISSGLDGIYPKGFPIGEIVAVERGQGLYQVVRIRPAVDFSAVEEVLVVVEPQPAPTGPATPGEGGSG